MNSFFMSAPKTYKKLDLKLIDEVDIGSILYRLYEDRIFHAIVKEGEKVTMEMVQKGYDFLDKNGGGVFYNIYEFRSFADIEPEVRNWSAQKSGNLYTHIDAIVINNFAQKILTDFYLKFNKPIKPTKIFFSVEKALEWVLLFIKEDKMTNPSSHESLPK